MKMMAELQLRQRGILMRREEQRDACNPKEPPPGTLPRSSRNQRTSRSTKRPRKPVNR